jgi:hypothetical protein
MHDRHAGRENELNPREIKVRFSPEVRSAFADLAAAVHFSEHFDADMRSILQEWAEGKAPTAHSFLTALPLVAEETFRHIHATNDLKAKDAWDEIASQLPEHGFTFAQKRIRSK